MAHSSLHTQQEHWFDEKFAQQGVGNAGFEPSPLHYFIDNWQLQSTHAESLFPLQLTSTAGEVALRLQLNAQQPFVLHGDAGVSKKTQDGKYRSYYYSQPFIQVEGEITHANTIHKVKGKGWYDHEWTSQLADDEALGWDWFSMHFNNGNKLMAFTMHVDGQPSHTTGTWISPDGSSETLTNSELTLTPILTKQVAERDVPLQWHINIPSRGVNITTEVFKDDQWNASRFPYYEGAIRFSGSHSGEGYMELTGY